MKTPIETERLILREILPSDEAAFFELDADPKVHTYLGNAPVESIEEIREVIQMIRQQYIDNGIGRWATIEKSSGNFIGWSGLKFIKELENNHSHFYDIGYRLMPKYWGKGYATESAMAALEYGFKNLKAKEIFGSANVDNLPSRRVLEKCGLVFVEKFMWNDIPCDWLKITKAEWEEKTKYKMP